MIAFFPLNYERYIMDILHKKSSRRETKPEVQLAASIPFILSFLLLSLSSSLSLLSLPLSLPNPYFFFLLSSSSLSSLSYASLPLLTFDSDSWFRFPLIFISFFLSLSISFFISFSFTLQTRHDKIIKRINFSFF